MNRNSHLIGITGGIGSGKSTVSDILKNFGTAIIDADQISRELTAANGLAIPLIEKEFSSALITADGSLNRSAMRELVFSDANSKKRLEDILHPLISSISGQRESAALAAQVPLIVHDVPLLIESYSKWRPKLDEIWVVDCSPETQIQRVMHRNQLSRAAIEQIIAKQASRSQRCELADVIILNENITLDELTTLVKKEVSRFGLS